MKKTYTENPAPAIDYINKNLGEIDDWAEFILLVGEANHAELFFSCFDSDGEHELVRLDIEQCCFPKTDCCDYPDGPMYISQHFGWITAAV